MGSSKKHKDKDREREHKRKRKHRSRSRERKRSKHSHRDRDGGENVEKDWHYDKDIEEGEIEDDLSAFPLKKESSGYEGGEGASESMSIEETNKLRAKLGLKPLEVNASSSGTEKESLKDDVHVPAVNLSDVKKTEKIREKLETAKAKRATAEKLGRMKTLGESDSEDEDSAAWVRKMRKKQKDQEMAAKRAKMLEEMDAEFGIGSLVEEEFKPAKDKQYSSKDLRGLTVQHSLDRFKEGQTVILTLEDKGVLDEEDGDTLINVNLIDSEKAEKNVENKKKKPDYNPYDECEEDEYGMLKPKEVLSKYNEEIEGMKREKFELGTGGKYDGTQDRQMDLIRQQLQAQRQSLSLSAPMLASEYMTAEEMQAKFKKVRKKVRKIRKKDILKADDLNPVDDTDDFGSRSRGRGKLVDPEDNPIDTGNYSILPGDHGKLPSEYTRVIPGLDVQAEVVRSIPDPEPDCMIVDDPDEDDEGDLLGPDEDLSGVPVDDDEVENELHAALTKARKLKLKKDRKDPNKVADVVLSSVKEEPENIGANIVLNSTSEFCRTLGEIPTYGQSGNRDEMDKEDLMDFEKELLEKRRKQEEEEEEQATGWNRVEIDETPVTIEGEENIGVLDDEPVVNQGVGGALLLAMKKGYMEKETKKKIRSVMASKLQALHYSIEDKRYDDLDEKYKKRDRYMGSLQEFKEKEGYRPDVKLEYVDDKGRFMNEKEAFRQLSHRFHGKGSGKKKTEKREKKQQEDNLMKRMSSDDTPLNTVALLKEKQVQEKTPYIVLTGNKGFTNPIVKPS